MARYIIIYRGEFFIEVEACSTDKAVEESEKKENWRFCGEQFNPGLLEVIQEVAEKKSEEMDEDCPGL